jgi:hypothetical protein
MMVGGIHRTPNRAEQRRAISCERQREDEVQALIQEAASATKPKKTKSADVTALVDSRFTQIRGELDGFIQQQMENLRTDFGARLSDVENEAANLKTSTTVTDQDKSDDNKNIGLKKNKKWIVKLKLPCGESTSHVAPKTTPGKSPGRPPRGNLSLLDKRLIEMLASFQKHQQRPTPSNVTSG